MCLHPKNNKDVSASDLNKITEELNERYTDMDSLNEFSGYCKYVSDINDLSCHGADLKFLHWNARSVLPKLTDLQQMLIQNDVDICTLNETWLKPSNKGLLKIKEFQCESSERDGLMKGGGVGMAIAKHLNYKRRTDLESKFSSLELCIVEIICRTKNILVVSLYQPPNEGDCSFMKHYKNLLNALSTENNKHIIIGSDHNYDLLKSSIHYKTREFLDVTINKDLWPVITKLTCITKSTATLIDNIIVSSSIHSKYLSGLLIDDRSDHLPCILVARNLNTTKKSPIIINSRKLTPKNLAKIKAGVAELDLANSIPLEDATEPFSNLHEKLVKVIDEIAPNQNFTPGKYSYRKEPWLPVTLLKFIKKQQTLYHKTLSHDCCDSDLIYYRSYRNTLTVLKRKCKILYYHEKCVEFKSNSKALWKIINKISGKENDKSTIITCIREGGIGHNNLKDIANIFNNHFSTIGKKFSNHIKKSKKYINDYIKIISHNTKSCYWEPTNMVEIGNIIDKLPNKRSSGYDQIDNLLLKELKSY